MTLIILCDTCGKTFAPRLKKETMRPVMQESWVEISARLHVCSARCLSRALRGLGLASRLTGGDKSSEKEEEA